jgi:hypothetical protein
MTRSNCHKKQELTSRFVCHRKQKPNIYRYTVIVLLLFLRFEAMNGRNICCFCAEIDVGGDRFSFQLCGMLTQMGEQGWRLNLLASIRELGIALMPAMN